MTQARPWLPLLLLAVSACGNDNLAAPPPGAPATSVPTAQVSPAFDMAGVIRQVHFGYRPAGTGWQAGHATYAVRAAEDGLALTPYHRDENDAALSGAPLRLVTRLDGNVAGFRATRADNGALAIDRGSVVERLENSDEGVEQSWTFAERPAGDGDVVVRLAVSGQTFAAATARGLHFVDPDTGVGFRYGHGTWIDAAGRRTPVPAAFVEGEIRLVVPADVVAASAFPAVLDPTISPEFGLDNPVSNPAFGRQDAPSVAFDGTNFLVVWEDERNPEDQEFGNFFEVVAARVSPSGQLLDPIGIPLGRLAQRPVVAFDGTNYVVAFVGLVDQTYQIRGVRVTKAGGLLDPMSLPISGHGTTVATAAAGGKTLVVWQENADLRGALLATNGSISAGPFLVSTGVAFTARPAVTFGSAGFTVTWVHGPSNGNSIHARRVSTAGALSGQEVTVYSYAANLFVGAPAIAFDGTNFLIAFDLPVSVGSQNRDLYAVRLSPAGQVLDADAFLYGHPASQSRVSVSFDGASYLLVFVDDRNGPDIYGLRVSPTRAVLDPSGIVISSAPFAQGNPRVATGGGVSLVVWGDQRSVAADVQGRADLFGARVDAAGSVLEGAAAGLLISRSSTHQRAPALAFDGVNFVAVWEDFRPDTRFDIYGARISVQGTVLDPAGIAIATGWGDQSDPDVACDGTSGCLVAWKGGGNMVPIYAARLSSTGAVLDTVAKQLSDTFSYGPAIAFGGGQYLVLWGAPQGKLGGRLAAPADFALSPMISLSVPATSASQPDVAFDGTNFLVAFTGTGSVSSNIFGARFTPTGTLLAASPFVICDAGDWQTSPAVACHGSNCLVVWTDALLSAWNGLDIFGTRVVLGTVLDRPSYLPIAVSPGNQEAPALTYDGLNHVVAWQDRSNGVDSDVLYGRIDVTGSALDGFAGLPLAGGAGNQRRPALAGAGNGKTLAAYDRFDPAASFGSQRVRAVKIEE